MTKILLLLSTTLALTAGTTPTAALTPVAPIEPPAKKVILLGGISNSYLNNDCVCGEAEATHIGATVGLDYALGDTFGVDARLTSNWLQTGLYLRVGNLSGIYGLIGANYSFDVEDVGVSGGVGIGVNNSLAIELIGTKMKDITLMSCSVLYRF